MWNWLKEMHKKMEEIKNWFILLTFIAVVVVPLAIYGYRLFFVDENQLILTVQDTHPGFKVNNPGEKYRINFIRIKLNDSLTKEKITMDNGGYFCFTAMIDSAIDSWLQKDNCENVILPIIIEAEYAFSGKMIDNQSEYSIKINKNENIRRIVTYVKQRTNNINKKVSINYLYKCSNN
jgi:hypothetical protein